METKLNIMVFGQLEDITGCSVVTVENVPNTDLLLEKLYAQYPLLKGKNFLIALDKKIITKKAEIGGKEDIALLPPFSGG
jgi:molybdopterin synthase sulfur carrier subunit